MMDEWGWCFGPEQLSEAAFTPQPELSATGDFGEMM